ncbi:MAG: glycosyltransferase family 2 protein [Deltaproteobacteria bacterium]|nr:MAG: glycosyltransferase family 2 protein [Deltaproteobacteria bacterium]
MEGLSVIVPAYNEEEGITGVLEGVKRLLDSEAHKGQYEILVVDDGSEDDTGRLAEKVEEIRIVRHSGNRGYGAAIKTGIRNSRYNTLAIIDADGSYPTHALGDLLPSGDEYDMVVGVRKVSRASVPWIRRPAKFFLTRLANYLAGCRIPDLNSGLRVFKKERVQEFFHLFPSGFSLTTTLTLAMLSSDYLVEWVPIDYQPRKGRSKIRPLRDTLNFLALIIRTILYFNPIKVFLPISGVLLFVGIVVGVAEAILIRNVTTVALMFIFTGVQVGMIGLLADLIEKRSKR